MKRLFTLILVAAMLAMAGAACATGWNEVQNGKFIELTPGTVDYDCLVAQAGTLAHANGLRVYSICLTSNPSTANNVVSLYNNVGKNYQNMTHCFPYQVDVSGVGITWYYGGQTIFPYITISESTLTNGKIIIQLAP